ncbi:hypothetical protein BSNK01_12500 [Bacillaceae bacterium]
MKRILYVSRLMKAKDVVKACREFREQEQKKKAAAQSQTA